MRQPQPFDLVDDPVQVCGVGTGFEGVLTARLRDATGATLAESTIRAGGTGIWANFHTTLGHGRRLPSVQGVLEVFVGSAQNGSDANGVAVPVIFGRALLEPYHGFAVHTVLAGETLLSITRHWYGDDRYLTVLYDANRHQIADPSRIWPGQLLRVPQ